jgi:hypothetical protein
MARAGEALLLLEGGAASCIRAGKTLGGAIAHHAQVRADEKKAAKASRIDIRATVAARAGGCCENCGARRGKALHWDHFWGRAREESVESTWLLCPRCDREKTESWDDRAKKHNRIAWLLRFGTHCFLHRYTDQIAKLDTAMALEHAQHPQPAVPPTTQE